MKNLKTKLLAAIAMLAVSAICLTSATFAWFTLSTNPEITGLTTTVTTNENLEIALDADYASEAAVDTASTYSSESLSGNYYTWGNLAALAADTKYTDLDKTLRPAKLDTTFKAATYGLDGRVSAIGTALTATDDTTTGSPFGTLIDAATNNVYGYYLDVWFRSNVGGQVTLVAAKDRDNSTQTNNTGAGSTFESTNDAKGQTLAANIRLAVQDITSGTTGTISELTTTPTATPDGKAVFTGNIVNLTANTAAKIRIFVYLDGTNVTNKAASIDGTPVTGTINLQFGIDGVDNSMIHVASGS